MLLYIFFSKMSDSGEDAIQAVENVIDQITESITQVNNLENAEKVEGGEDGGMEGMETGNLENSESVETQKVDNSDISESQTAEVEVEVELEVEAEKPNPDTMEADTVYDQITPISNATLHRMYKITILNENIKEYYMNNLIRSMIRDVIGHARRRLKTIRYNSLGITKQEDDIYKAKGLYKEKEFMIIKQALQTKFPSANIKITKQKPLSENHIPVSFEISWEALEIGEEEVEEEIKAVPETPKVEIEAKKVEVEKPVLESQKVEVVPEVPVPVSAPTPTPPPVLNEKQKQKKEEELNRNMNADYAIQKFLQRKRYG